MAKRRRRRQSRDDKTRPRRPPRKKRNAIEDQPVTLSPERGDTGLADYATAGREADERAGDEGIDDDLK